MERQCLGYKSGWRAKNPTQTRWLHVDVPWRHGRGQHDADGDEEIRREGSVSVDRIGTASNLMPKDPVSLSKFTDDFTRGEPYVMFPGSDYVHLMIPVEGYYRHQPESSPTPSPDR